MLEAKSCVWDTFCPRAAFPPQTCLSLPGYESQRLYKQKVLHTCGFAGLLFSGTRSLGIYIG